MHVVQFVFFKQSTAYEMRISDWSSDVCSSDLLDHRIEMAMTVAGLAATAPITIDDIAPVATSYPAFFDTLDQLTGPVCSLPSMAPPRRARARSRASSRIVTSRTAGRRDWHRCVST